MNTVVGAFRRGWAVVAIVVLTSSQGQSADVRLIPNATMNGYKFPVKVMQLQVVPAGAIGTPLTLHGVVTYPLMNPRPRLMIWGCGPPPVLGGRSEPVLLTTGCEHFTPEPVRLHGEYEVIVTYRQGWLFDEPTEMRNVTFRNGNASFGFVPWDKTIEKVTVRVP